MVGGIQRQYHYNPHVILKGISYDMGNNSMTLYIGQNGDTFRTLWQISLIYILYVPRQSF